MQIVLLQLALLGIASAVLALAGSAVDLVTAAAAQSFPLPRAREFGSRRRKLVAVVLRLPGRGDGAFLALTHPPLLSFLPRAGRRTPGAAEDRGRLAGPGL